MALGPGRLARQRVDLKPYYDFVIVGSGYGGAICAARLATADLDPKPLVCLLERGKEWFVGDFPDTAEGVAANVYNDWNRLGLYEAVLGRDISVIKGSGLGGTSLINANVAIEPDEDVFEFAGWPKSLRLESLRKYYGMARTVLAAVQHPCGERLKKVQALNRRARELGTKVQLLNVAINFHFGAEKNPNPFGAFQQECIGCGDCVTGCNVGAKNTLYMNYLPMARQAGAEIFTQMEVTHFQRASEGGWQVHMNYYQDKDSSPLPLTVRAKNLILGAGSINTPEILLRSQTDQLAFSTTLGTCFSGNADFFGVAYNGNYITQVLGYGNHKDSPFFSDPPGPTIVSALRYSDGLPINKRITIEDLTFPKASLETARTLLALLRGKDTDAGDFWTEELQIARDLIPFRNADPQGALNHTMMYLVMGFDDAQGVLALKGTKDSKVQITWHGVGQEAIFSRINEELLRHAESLGASYIEDPLWRFMGLDPGALVTAHPLGGCPLGEDHYQGAVDQYGRVFTRDGTVHEGLFVADGSLLPSSVGVNPFLTISALAEYIIERKIQDMKGAYYDRPKTPTGPPPVDPLDLVTWSESRLDQAFLVSSSDFSIDTMTNSGRRVVDLEKQVIHSDLFWTGFFPRGHMLDEYSSLLNISFKKRFYKEGDQYLGITSDTDDHIRARNVLREVNLDRRVNDLDKGKYVLLEYPDFPWQGFFDVFRIINENVLIARLYLGKFPEGKLLFTFPMTREYGFERMTFADHSEIWSQAAVPTKEDLVGLWRMDVISNANHAGALAYLDFDLKPDGRLESRYLLMGLIEGLVTPSFVGTHFQLNDFTFFHDEIRKIGDDLLIGRWVFEISKSGSLWAPEGSFGIFHEEITSDDRRRLGFYYLLSSSSGSVLPTNRLLKPFLDVKLPDGTGVRFDEKMVGYYFPGKFVSGTGPRSDLEIARWIPASGSPSNGIHCGVALRIEALNLNSFIESDSHEASVQGEVHFERFQGENQAKYRIDGEKSRFNLYRLNPLTREIEMNYHIEFDASDGTRHSLQGTKYIQQDMGGGLTGIKDILYDHTTLFCHVFAHTNNDKREIGTGLLKFKTFENLSAVHDLTSFLLSFTVTGPHAKNPHVQFQGRLRLLAFIAEIVLREYDPLTPRVKHLNEEVQAQVDRGADSSDFFSTRPSPELQQVLRDSTTLPLEKLLNSGSVRFDFDSRRIFRDSFWKGSFSNDSVLGWEERARNVVVNKDVQPMGSYFAGGSFWKRFDKVEGVQAVGEVVNFEVSLLPGDPVVTQSAYPDDKRSYLRKGDSFLLLQYKNAPYTRVYDVIKIIDENNCIGVMHLGTFPDGFEFATFVMSRNNYPFEKMSVEDHKAIFDHPRATIPALDQLRGRWAGTLVFLTQPNYSLLNQFNPVLLNVEFTDAGSTVRANYHFGFSSAEDSDKLSGIWKELDKLKDLWHNIAANFSDQWTKIITSESAQSEIRMIGQNMMIGRWGYVGSYELLLNRLQNHVEPAHDGVTFRFILERA